MSGIPQPVWQAIIGFVSLYLIKPLVQRTVEVLRFTGARAVEREIELLEKFEKAARTRPSAEPGAFELHASAVERAQEHSYRAHDREYKFSIGLVFVFGIPYSIAFGASIIGDLPKNMREGAFSVWLMISLCFLMYSASSILNSYNRKRKLIDKRRERWRATGVYPKPEEVTLDPEPPGVVMSSWLWCWRKIRKATGWLFSPLRALWRRVLRRQKRASNASAQTLGTQGTIELPIAEGAVLELASPPQDSSPPAAP